VQGLGDELASAFGPEHPGTLQALALAAEGRTAID
jgi:hypothetical protein